jgi:DNA-binding MarR family transcriptional regulator
MNARTPADAAPLSAATAGVSARAEALQALEGSFERLMQQWRRSYAEAAECVSPGMLPATYKVLTTISREGAATVSTLAEHLAADKGFVSRTVSELEELALVTRVPDPHDGRVRLISVTENGRSRLQLARAPYQHLLAEELDSWPVTSIEQLTTLLNALATGETPHG